MIEFADVSFKYAITKADGVKEDVAGVRNINLAIRDGEFVVLTGGSGCGKTTLIRLINGLIPHFYNGEINGKVTVANRVVKDTPIYELSEKVGSVFQNPKTQFFNVNTTDEIAFAAENQRRKPEQIRAHIKNTADSLKINELLDRSIFELSGGEKQIVACAGIAVLSPSVIVLDEPSSNLDHDAIGRLGRILKTWKKEGKTIVVAEHRLFYLRELADRMLLLKDGRIEQEYDPKEINRLTFNDTKELGIRTLSLFDVPCEQTEKTIAKDYLRLENFDFSYKDKKHSIHIPQLSIPGGCIVAIIGCNGAGKSTLARNICGLEKQCKGTMEYGGKRMKYRDRLHNCYMIMQDVNHQLFTESVGDEVMLSMTDKTLKEEEKKSRAHTILKELDLDELFETHPMALSGGQKQRVAIASGIASSKPILLFDEPTSGLDLFHMKQVASQVKTLKELGKTVLIITHDYEFLLQCCDYIVEMKDGQVKDSYLLEDSTMNKLKDFVLMQTKGGEDNV